MADFEIPNTSEKNNMSALLALPPVGGAAIRTHKFPSASFPKVLDRALGFTKKVAFCMGKKNPASAGFFNKMCMITTG